MEAERYRDGTDRGASGFPASITLEQAIELVDARAAAAPSTKMKGKRGKAPAKKAAKAPAKTAPAKTAPTKTARQAAARKGSPRRTATRKSASGS